jgi:hypothetical protein
VRWQPFFSVSRSFWMEVEVSALMGAVDEALWKSVGLFTSTDELSAGIVLPGTLPPSVGHSSFSPLVSTEPTDPLSQSPPDFLPGLVSSHRRSSTDFHQSAGKQTGRPPQKRWLPRDPGTKRVWKPNKAKAQTSHGV